MRLPATFGAALDAARNRIEAREARLLLREASGASAAAVQAFPERALDPAAASRYLDWLERRSAGEPVAYLLGVREFYGRDFSVSPAVLIPRPETELLVETVLARTADIAEPDLLDLGTGSGAIAITLALEAPRARVAAVERSASALAIAQRNATRLGARIEWLAGSWLEPVGGRRFDCIASNPPYVRDDDPHLADGDVRFEPRSALAAGSDGMDDIRCIVATAAAHLVPGGWLMFEHGYDQAAAVRAELIAAGFDAVESLRDLAGIERVSLGRRVD